MIALKKYLKPICQCQIVNKAGKVLSAVQEVFCLLPLVFRALIIIPCIFIIGLEIAIWLNQAPIAKALTQIDNRRIQHPNYHIQSQNALSQFYRLAPIEQSNLMKNLTANLWSLERWKSQFKTIDDSIICLGESHLEATREFIAQQLFNTLQIDDLYLETTAPKLQKTIKALETQSDYYPLLGADILETLHSAQKRNPNVSLYPIEASSAQMQAAKKGLSSREQSIIDNFLAQYQASRRRLVLIGGLHCANKAHWFFKQLNEKHWQQAPKLFNTQIFNEHQDGPIEAFVYFLDELALTKGDFVIADSAAFSTLIKRWFALSQRVTFKPYQSIIIYRNR